jgi:hypothetical protein
MLSYGGQAFFYVYKKLDNLLPSSSLVERLKPLVNALYQKN